MAYCPDDIIITPEGVARLVALAEKHPVVMGTMNVTIADHNNPDGQINITKNVVQLEKPRVYDFYTKRQVDGSVIQIPWGGFAFGIFERSVMEGLSCLGPEAPPVQSPIDNLVCLELYHKGIPVVADTSVYFYHHRLMENRRTEQEEIFQCTSAQAQ